MKVAVIGAGPAGLAAAWELSRVGHHVILYERSASLGGLARSLALWGQTVELGSHIIGTDDARVENLWAETIGADSRTIEVRRGIFTDDGVLDYPLKGSSLLRKLGARRSLRAGLSLIRGRLGRAEEDSCESWFVHRFGRELFTRFFKSYAEKLFGLPCSAIDPAFARLLVEGPPGDVQRQSAAKFTRFQYPSGGLEQLWSVMADQIQQRGGAIRLKVPIVGLMLDGSRVCGVRTPDEERADAVVSTMPLTALIRSLSPPPAVLDAASDLRFRSTVLLFFHVSHNDMGDYCWLHLYASTFQTGRVTSFHPWGRTASGGSILVLELWCQAGDALWSRDDTALLALGQAELRRAGLLHAPPLDGAVHRVPMSHPIYTRGFASRLQPLQDYIAGLSGLRSIGRGGGFSFNSIDESIRTGLDAAIF